MILAVAAVCMFQSAACSQEESARYFAELRQRHLFRVAEAYCLNQLKRADIPAEQRAELTLELARTFVEHARNTRREDQDEVWQRAALTLDDAGAFPLDAPQKSRLELERALVSARRGDFLAWEVDFSPFDSGLRKTAREALSDSVKRLEEFGEASDKPRLNPERPAAVRETPAERAERQLLRTESKLQLAAALLNRAGIDDGDASHRAADLNQVEKLLKPLMTGKLEVRSRARTMLAEMSRLRKDFGAAHRQLEAAIAESPPPEISDAIVAEQVKVLLDEKRPADAAESLVVYRRTRGALAGELGMLKVQSTLAMLKLARDKGQTELAGELLAQAEKHVLLAEQDAGGYWAYRGRLLLTRAKGDSAVGDELAALLRTAEGLHADGKLQPAIDAYGKAFEAAQRSGNEQLASESGFTRASLQVEAGDLSSAAEAFQHLAKQYPKSPRAAAAHLMWAYVLGRLFDRDKSEDARKAYALALDAHLKEFAQSPTAIDAKWMLARFEEGRQNVQRALDLYLQIPADHKRGLQSQADVARCYELLLLERQKQNEPLDTLRETAVKQLQAYIAKFPPPQQAWNAVQSEISLRLASIQLTGAPPDYEAADELLGRILTSLNGEMPGEPAAAESRAFLKKTSTQLRVVSLAGRGRTKEASQLIADLAATSTTGEIMGILAGLSTVVAKSDPLLRSTLGQLELDATATLNVRRSELSEEDQERLDFYRAQSYVAMGDDKRAIALFEEQIVKSPSDRKLLQRAAHALSTFETKLCQEKSKSLWRRLESLEQPGSVRWLNARYFVALSSFRLKQFEECASLLRATRLLYPELGGPVLREQFSALERELIQSR